MNASARESLPLVAFGNVIAECALGERLASAD
jgi:hypothetical protein